MQAGTTKTRGRCILNRDLAGEQSSHFGDVNRETWFELKAEQFFVPYILNYFPPSFGFLNFESQTALLTVHAFRSVYALPKQWEPAREGCLSVPRLPPSCSFFLVKHAQYRSISDLRPELGRCFAGDSGMVINVVLFPVVSIICISKLLSMKRSLFLRAM